MQTSASIAAYKAPKGATKKDTTPPCALCGWCPEEAIHTNPELIGRGGPYHEFVPIRQEQTTK